MGVAKNRCALGRAAIFCLILGPGGLQKIVARWGAQRFFVYFWGPGASSFLRLRWGGGGGSDPYAPDHN